MILIFVVNILVDEMMVKKKRGWFIKIYLERAYNDMDGLLVDLNKAVGGFSYSSKWGKKSQLGKL